MVPQVHSSMYRGLRTNLPREVMSYTDFPFVRPFGADARRFCGHQEVSACPLLGFGTNLLP